MTSKELLNKVLNIEIVSYQMKQKNILAYEYNKVSKNQWSGKTFCNRSINIYELAHKCKEWALSKGYIINSGATTSNDWSSTIYKVIKENPYIKELSHTWGQSENEAIFRACQWILDKDSK